MPLAAAERSLWRDRYAAKVSSRHTSDLFEICLDSTIYCVSTTGRGLRSRRKHTPFQIIAFLRRYETRSQKAPERWLCWDTDCDGDRAVPVSLAGASSLGIMPTICFSYAVIERGGFVESRSRPRPLPFYTYQESRRQIHNALETDTPVPRHTRQLGFSFDPEEFHEAQPFSTRPLEPADFRRPALAAALQYRRATRQGHHEQKAGRRQTPSTASADRGRSGFGGSRCISSVRATRGIGGGAVAASKIVPRLHGAIWRASSLEGSPWGRRPWRRRVYWRGWRRKSVGEAAVDITGAVRDDVRGYRRRRLRLGVAGYVARPSSPRRAGRRAHQRLGRDEEGGEAVVCAKLAWRPGSRPLCQVCWGMRLGYAEDRVLWRTEVRTWRGVARRQDYPRGARSQMVVVSPCS